MQSFELLIASSESTDGTGAEPGSECLDGAFLETAFTREQVEKANILELTQLQEVPCQFLSDV